MSEKIDPSAMPQSAEALRMSILKKEMERMDVERKAREAEERRLAAFTDDFLHKHVSEDEVAIVRRLVEHVAGVHAVGGHGHVHVGVDEAGQDRGAGRVDHPVRSGDIWCLGVRAHPVDAGGARGLRSCRPPGHGLRHVPHGIWGVLVRGQRTHGLSL